MYGLHVTNRQNFVRTCLELHSNLKQEQKFLPIVDPVPIDPACAQEDLKNVPQTEKIPTPNGYSGSTALAC